MIQEKTSDLFLEFISKRSIVFDATDEDFIDNYKKIYCFINSEEMDPE